MRRNHCLHLDAYFLAHQAPTDSSKATVTQMDLVKLKGGGEHHKAIDISMRKKRKGG